MTRTGRGQEHGLGGLEVGPAASLVGGNAGARAVKGGSCMAGRRGMKGVASDGQGIRDRTRLGGAEEGLARRYSFAG